MKALDEVIKRIEIYKNIFDKNGCFECHYHEDDCIDSCFLENVLHYLKTIETTENLYHDAVNELSKWKDEDWKDRYLPLTWDELKQMEGKPVWIEMEGYKPNWGIVMNQDERNGNLLLCGYDKVAIRIEINKEGEGNKWQAYKKERDEDAG